MRAGGARGAEGEGSGELPQPGFSTLLLPAWGSVFETQRSPGQGLEACEEPSRSETLRGAGAGRGILGPGSEGVTWPPSLGGHGRAGERPKSQSLPALLPGRMLSRGSSSGETAWAGRG